MTVLARRVLAIIVGLSVAALAGAIVLYRAAPVTLPTPSLGHRTLAVCPNRGTPDFFFGNATLPVDPDDKYSQRYWVALRLNSIGAGSLSCGESSETYRLVWMFDARTKLVTIAAGADGNWTVEGIHYLQSRLPKSATVIARSPTRRLSANEASEFVDNLRRSQLWTTPGWTNDRESCLDAITPFTAVYGDGGEKT
jgi:hypothetical protein